MNELDIIPKEKTLLSNTDHIFQGITVLYSSGTAGLQLARSSLNKASGYHLRKYTHLPA